MKLPGGGTGGLVSWEWLTCYPERFNQLVIGLPLTVADGANMHADSVPFIFSFVKRNFNGMGLFYTRAGVHFIVL